MAASTISFWLVGILSYEMRGGGTRKIPSTGLGKSCEEVSGSIGEGAEKVTIWVLAITGSMVAAVIAEWRGRVGNDWDDWEVVELAMGNVGASGIELGRRAPITSSSLESVSS